MTSIWTIESIEYVRTALLEGYSAAVIAAEVSRQWGYVTRNAVIGIKHRKGFTGGLNNAKPGRPRKRVHKARVVTNVQSRVEALERIARVGVPETPIADTEIPQSQRRGVLELTCDTCRWPVGDPAKPEFFFCGAMPQRPLPYCAAHARGAYDLPADRRRLAHLAQCATITSTGGTNG